MTQLVVVAVVAVVVVVVVVVVVGHTSRLEDCERGAAEETVKREGVPPPLV